MSAVADLTHFPLVGKFRLADVVASGPGLPILETTESTDVEDTVSRVIFMNWAAQNSQPSEVPGHHHINVELSQEFGKIIPRRQWPQKKSFEVQTYLTGPVVITEDDNEDEDGDKDEDEE